MKHNYFNLNQNASKNDGQVPRNVQMSRYCPQPDSVSNPCRCRDLATPRVFSAVFTARAWKYVAIIFAVLTLSMANVGTAWGDVHLYDAWIKASFNGSSCAWEGDGYHMYSGGPNATVGTAAQMGVLTGDFVINDFKVKINSNYKLTSSNHKVWCNVDGSDNYKEYIEYWGVSEGDQWPSHASIDLNMAHSTDPSGYHSLNVGFISQFQFSDGWETPQELKTYYFSYTVLPPAVSSFTVTPTGAVSGDGTEGNPYIIPYGGDLKLTMSGSQGHSDANSSAKYYNTNSASSWTDQAYKTISNVTETSNQSVTIKMCYENNSSSELHGTESTKTVYYKAAKGVSVYKFVPATSGLGTEQICTNTTAVPLTVANNKLSVMVGGTLNAKSDKASGSNHISYNNNSFKVSGADSWFVLGLDNKIKAGDVIRYRYTDASSNTIQLSIRTATGTSTNQINLPGTSTTKGIIQTVAITDAQATAFASSSTVYLLRTGSNTAYLDYFEILRPYKVTLNASTNSGKVEGENTKIMYFAAGEPQLLPRATKSSNRFKGWYTASDNDTRVLDYYTATADNTTLYAQFDACTEEGTLYKFQVKSDLTTENFSETSPIDLNVGNYLTSLTGGTLAGNRGGSSNNYITKVNGSGIQIKDNGGCLQIDLDCALQAGDTIKTIVTSKTAFLDDNSTRQSTPEMTVATSSNTSTYQKQVIAEGSKLIGKSTIYMYKGSGNCNVLYLEIIRPEACTPITPTFSTAYTSTILTLGGGNSSTPAINKDGSAGAITWTSSNTGVATVNSSGVVTPKKIGTATITATVAAAGGKCEGSVSADFTIKGTITYNANTGSGSVPTDASTYAKDAKITVAGKNTLTKADCAFAGWNTKANGSGDWYIPGEKITMGESNITLYAQWATCISTSDFSGRKAAGYDDASETSSDLKDSFSILNKLGGSTTYDNSSGYTGLKLRNSGDWIGFAVAAGSSVTVTTQTVSTSPTVTIDFSSATTLSANTDNVYAADNSNIRFFRIKAADGAAVVINKITIGASCTTNPTVTAGSNSSITATTVTVSCSSGITSLGSAGCSITSYGFVIGTSANPAIGGSGVTQHQVGTSYASTGTSFSKNLTGLTAGTTYYVRPYATNGNGTAYGDQTSFTTLPTTPTFSPASGSTVNGSQTITITGHSGSTVYYVWATSAPSASDIYNSGSGSHGTADAGTASVPVQSGKTLYAISRISGVNSSVSSAAYTVDATAPTLSSSTPADDATGVNTSGNIVLTFSENVTIADASKFTISPSAGVTLNTAGATASTNTVTIPYSGLSNSTEYTFSTAAGAVQDAAGNLNAALSGISFTTKAATTYTVTYNAQGGSVTPTSETVSTATLPTPTKSGYTFDGWYTSGGSKITGTYNPTANITLYAQWKENCAAGGTTTLADINFKAASWTGKTFSQGNTDNEDLINSVYFWAKSSDASKQFSLESNTTNGLTFPNNNMASGTYYFCIPITGINSSNKQITVTLKHGYSNATASFKYAYVDGRTSWTDGNTGGSATSVSDANKTDTEISITLSKLSNTSGHLMIGRNSSSYPNIYGVMVTTPGAAGTCYYVLYNGNGATGGYTTDETAYESGDNADAATNGFTKTGYTFGGWADSKEKADAGTKDYDPGDDISISGNVTLYAIWEAAAGHTLSWDKNGGSTLTGDYSSGSIVDGTTITAPNNPTRSNYTFDSWNTAADGSGDAFTGTMPAADTKYYAVWKNTLTLTTGSQGSGSNKTPKVLLGGSSLSGFSAHTAAGYTLQGYYTETSGGTKVLNADGSFAATNIARYVTDGKWSRSTGDTTLVAQWESSYLLKWNLQLNKSESPITTTSKESATVRISTSNMGNLTANGSLRITSSAKSGLTSKIASTVGYTGDDAGKYMSVQFTVANGYKLIPSAVKVTVQPISTAKYVRLELSDNNSHSINYTSSSISGGSTQTINMSNGSSVEFTGTVTLKIYCYNGTASDDGYRLGSPIQIDGSIEEGCTMPSFSGVDYDQTEYVQNAEASAISVTGGTNVTSYAWKQSSTNDYAAGSAASGTNNTSSYTPPTTSTGKMYYWCEMMNSTCGPVRTPKIAITVSSAVTATTVTWTKPDDVYYGGGGYVIRATVDQSGWGGTLSASDLSAPSGISIHDVTTGTDGSSKNYIEAQFDVQTSFDRDNNDVIDFALTHDAVTGYSAINAETTVDYDACAGGDGSTYNVRVRKNRDQDANNNYRWVTPGAGELTTKLNSSIGSNKASSTMATVFDSVASSSTQNVWIKTFVDNIKTIRFYGSFESKTTTLTNIYIASSYKAADSKDEYTSYTMTYEGGGDDVGSSGQHYIDIALNEALSANDIILLKFSDSKVKPLGAALTEVSGGASLTTDLAWSGGLSNGGTVSDKTQSSANFTYTASQSGTYDNSLGAITYSSSNTDCATVNATTGEVTITATGGSALSTTIKATLAKSGCFKSKEITYTLTIPGVSCTIAAGTLTSDVTSKCSTVDATLTLTGFESGGTATWYKGDDELSNGATYAITTNGTTSTLVTKEAGTYSVTTTKDACTVRSNSVTITNVASEASAEKIVDEWFIKNGRLTPDIALWKLGKGATFVSAAWSPSNTTGLTGANDIYAKDSIVYLTGKEPVANNSSDKEYTLTLTVEDPCNVNHELTTKTIKITHQKNTDKHVLAFVVNGTGKAGFTDGITADQTTNVPLYNTLAENFDVIATNIYSTDDEQKIKEYYSQFDILCITDYPNSNTKGAHGKKYVDAMGALVDIRPILTMEAFVSDKANWKAKGISGNPKDPTTRQYNMLLQCKDHEIFAGTTTVKIGEGDQAMYKLNMVDSTKESYATLDATYGATLPHEKSTNYKYHDCPALQGFTYTSSMSDLLPLGLIGDGGGNDLQVGIERQAVMSARLMVLGVNAYAMERLSSDGETVIINALKYLMKKNAEDIADCSVYFDNANGTGIWNDEGNWGPSHASLPLPTQEVRILQPCTISTTAHVASVKIVPDGTYNYGAATANGKLTIEPTGALIVDGKVQAVTAPLYYEKRATTPEQLIIHTNSSNQSCLILDNEDASTKATVNLYSLGRKIGSKYQFQYYAVPMEVVPVNPSFAGTGIYTYVWHENGGWERRGYYTDLYAFEGIGITTSGADPRTYTMTGNLASTADKEITLTKESDGENIIGNSWTAPINIASLVDAFAEDENVEKTVYLYITGNDNMVGANSTTEVAGKWLAIPIDASGWPGWKGQKVIPAMQAFYIKANAATTLTLNYDEMVRTTPNEKLNSPLKAPRRAPLSADAISLLKLRVEDSSTHTDLYLFEGNRFSDSYDNGWEAKQMGGDGCMQLYAQNEADKMAVLATDELEGTVVGFEPGKETGYTISFSGEGNGYYLNDIKLRNSVRISEGETYTFTYEKGDAANRFYISRTAINAPEVATGMENLDAAAPRVQKIIYNDKLYIIRGGRLYDATGKVVK